jgi:hypothetical protein
MNTNIVLKMAQPTSLEVQKKKKKFGPQGPGVNEVSFRSRPHHNMHCTLGVDIGATGPL